MIVLTGNYSPTLKELQSAKLDGNCVLVSREILADLDTPVSAYLKLRGEGESFLLESAEGGERIGRYSFVGSNPRQVLRVKDGMQWIGEEHLQRGVDVGQRFLDDRGAFVDLAAFEAVLRARDRECKGPLVQPHAADPERVFHALAGTGNEPVERSRDPEPQLGHVLPPMET